MAEAAIDYEELKLAVRDNDPKIRMRVAADPAMPAEFLYFLAGDSAVEVRCAVAGNRATPTQADMLLARDADYGVRCALARKAVGEGLGADERRGLWRMGFTILETLACDQLVRVRSILSEAFKSPSDAPADIVRQLARDTAREVAAPVLRASPVLTDMDIIDIVANDAPVWVHEAVAGRDTVSPAVSEVLAQSGPVSTVGAMIANPGAEIDEPTMAGIVARAAEAPELQEPLVKRPSLSQTMIVKLAQFVAAPLLALLRERDGLDGATVAELDQAAERRGATPDNGRAGRGPFGSKRKKNGSRKAKDADGDSAGDRPSDDAVSAALDNGDYDFVIEALAQRAGMSIALVRNMVASGGAKTITALCWKAGLTMRFAMDVQRRIGHIPPQSVLNARDGVDYPLSPQKMTEQLTLFTG